MVAKPREKAVERMIDGEFLFRSVDFTRTDGFRAEVQRIADGYAFRADIPLGVLSHDQMEAIKNNSWGRKNVAMSILVKEFNQNYTSAKIVAVRDIGTKEQAGLSG